MTLRGGWEACLPTNGQKGRRQGERGEWDRGTEGPSTADRQLTARSRVPLTVKLRDHVIDDALLRVRVLDSGVIVRHEITLKNTTGEATVTR